MTVKNQPTLEPHHEIRPNPDPSEMTTRQLLREIQLTRERFHAEDAAILSKLETRLNGMDKAVERLQAEADKQPTTEAVDLNVKALTILVEEKFAGIKGQLIERQRAVETNMQSIKESSDERNRTTEATTNAINDKISDLKDRIGSIESRGKGAGDMWGYIIAAICAATTVIACGLLAFSVLNKP